MKKKLFEYLPIILILFFAIFTRFWRLNIPNTYYFDEVYHAFTAKEMLLGNPAAWEFWGFALASKWTALYGIFVFSFFFIREYLSIKTQEKVIFVKKMFFIIPVFFFIIPVFIYILSYSPFFFLSDPNIPYHIDPQSNVIKIERAVCLPILPETYCDRLAIVWSVQQQMYWYHTKLKATHLYQSLWYTWPFDIRPVYYYVGNFGESIAQIYAIGNPIILWAGIPAIFFAIYRLLKKHSFNLGLILVCYLSFWLPWSLSPRIMFLYHYLPSIPFLAILIAYALRELWSDYYGKIVVLYYLFLVVISFVYFYPHVAAWPVPTTFYNSYFWFPSWR